MDKCWVAMTDSWTLRSEGKVAISKIVFECDGMEEAQAISQIANLKTGFQHISISRKKPHYNSEFYRVTYYTRKTAKPGWYPVKEDKPNEV